MPYRLPRVDGGKDGGRGECRDSGESRGAQVNATGTGVVVVCNLPVLGI